MKHPKKGAPNYKKCKIKKKPFFGSGGGFYDDNNLKYNFNYMRKPIRIHVNFVKKATGYTYNSVSRIEVEYAQFKWNCGRVKWDICEVGEQWHEFKHWKNTGQETAEGYIDIDAGNEHNEEYIERIEYFCSIRRERNKRDQ